MKEEFDIKKKYELWILLVFLIGLGIYKFWPDSPEAMMTRQLDGLATLCSFTQKSGIVQASLSSDKLGDFFTDGASVLIVSPWRVSISTLPTIKQRYVYAHKFFKSLEISFKDINFPKIEKQEATVSCTLSATGKGTSNFQEFQEIEIQFKKIADQWKIHHLKQVEGIE